MDGILVKIIIAVLHAVAEALGKGKDLDIKDEWKNV